MISEIVATYIYDKDIEYRVYACYDSLEDYDESKISFYDVYERRDNGDETSWICVNEGEPYYYIAPTWDDIYKHYYRPSYI